MESVSNNYEINELYENKIIGNPKLVNSNIIFRGKGNILFCEESVNIVNSNINFIGNNSLIFLSSSKSNYPVNIQIFQDSILFIGRNNQFTATITFDVQEHQNLIIGDDCIINGGVTFKTSDAHIIYDSSSKKRINHSKSILIGDHVWLGQQTYVSKGVRIGSGTILDSFSYVPSNILLKSNNLYGGNPITVLKKIYFSHLIMWGILLKQILQIMRIILAEFFYLKIFLVNH